MPFQPKVGRELVIDSVTYRIAGHPAAPGMPYGQEGRQAVVYQLVAQDGDAQALKVCRRTVLSARRNRDLLRQHPDLTYAVLTPWGDADSG